MSRDLTGPFFSRSRGEWVQIDWSSGGIDGMNLLLDLTNHVDQRVAIRRFEARQRTKKETDRQAGPTSTSSRRPGPPSGSTLEPNT